MFDEAAPRRRKQRLDPGGLTTGHVWEGCRWLPLTRHALNWFPEYGGSVSPLCPTCAPVKANGAARKARERDKRAKETRLRGWACEIRTQKCRRKLSL